MDPRCVGITADDLTGAADTAAALARPGAPVLVSLGVAPRVAGAGRAFAVTTDTRSCDPDTAYRVTGESVRLLREAGAELIYKKVDSNLRGNVGSELAAVCEARGGPVVLSPALPARGRTVVNGVALAHRVPVAETEMARDPEAPVTESNVLALLRAQRRELAISHCPLAAVRAGAGAIRQRLPARGVLVVDAESDGDLDAIAEAALSPDPLPTLAGSAGLAAALGRRLLGPAARLPLPPGASGPVLAVLASSSAVLLQQVEHAASDVRVRVISLPCEHLSREEGAAPEVDEAIAQAAVALAAGWDAIVHATGPLPRVERPVELVVEHLTHIAFVLAGRARPTALLLGGGATAQAVLRALNARAIEVDDEPLPGIAAGTAIEGRWAGRPAALKPGAAGAGGAVAGLLAYLRHRAAACEG